MNRPIRHVGPSVSEQALFTIWDRVEQARQRGGERAARALAERTLKAIASAELSKKEETRQ
jgi:hypothetical protein